MTFILGRLFVRAENSIGLFCADVIFFLQLLCPFYQFYNLKYLYVILKCSALIFFYFSIEICIFVDDFEIYLLSLIVCTSAS